LILDDTLIVMIFGWPAILGSLLLSLVGLVFRRPVLLIAAGVVIIPFSWYLSGFPAVRAPGILLCLFQFGSAAAVWRGRMPAAWLLLLPLTLIAAVLAYVVLTQ
jgi:hypothetical protein